MFGLFAPIVPPYAQGKTPPQRGILDGLLSVLEPVRVAYVEPPSSPQTTPRATDRNANANDRTANRP